MHRAVWPAKLDPNLIDATARKLQPNKDPQKNSGDTSTGHSLTDTVSFLAPNTWQALQSEEHFRMNDEKSNNRL